jgi:malate/lactate dehydrogenase
MTPASLALAVAARIAQLVLRDQRALVPIGSYSKGFGVTLSLSSVVGRAGVMRCFEPEMLGEERRASDRRTRMLPINIPSANWDLYP